MANIREPLEIRGNKGRFRYVEYSDEQRNPIYHPLCDCLDGHDSPKEARLCVQKKEFFARLEAKGISPAEAWRRFEDWFRKAKESGEFVEAAGEAAKKGE